MDKKLRCVGLVVVFLIVLGLGGKVFSFSADVEDLSGNKYFPAVKRALSEAEKSIFMVMYLVRLNPSHKESGVYRLVNELIKAHKRGVTVEVILDQNVGFTEGRGEWQVEGKNSQAFWFLSKAGVKVWYDDAKQYTHSKCLIIDEEKGILGSANWTESGLFRNNEASVLVKSKELAANLLNNFRRIERMDRAPRITKEPLILSWMFLEDKDLGGKMVSSHDERAFDLYLLLLREFDGNETGRVKVDYEKLAGELGLGELSRTAYRRQINRSLRKLEKRYCLLRFEPVYGKAGTVFLLSYESKNEAYRPPQEWYFQIPAAYWNYGWARKLSFPAKYGYLINLAYAGISEARPWWFASRKILSERFKISKWFISRGMQELRRLNVIDVQYGGIEKEGRKEKTAKSYKLIGLYDPAKVEEQWDKLEVLYGKKSLEKARGYARLVFEENSPVTIKDLLERIKIYGDDKVKRAFDIVERKNIDNPKRNYGYVVGILRRMAQGN